MKALMLKCLFIMLLCAFVVSNINIYAFAEGDDAISCNISTAVLNRYVFRGYEISSNSIVIQPSLTLSYDRFSANLWGNVDSNEHATQYFIPDKPEKTSFNETDITLAYTHSIDKLALTAGYAFYAMKYSILGNTEEVFLTTSYNVLGKPTLSFYRDIEQFPGTYLNFTLSHSIEICKNNNITLDFGVSAGYCAGDGNWCRTYQTSTNSYDGERYKAWHDGMAKIGMTIPVTQKLSVYPLVQYWFPLSSKAGKTLEGNAYNPSGKIDETFILGISINYSL